MSDARLNDLVALIDAAFMTEQARLRGISAEEARLREALRHLDDRHGAARAAQRDDVSGLRTYGGDVLWQCWVGRSRRDLQIRLAQVLARKGRMLEALRRAHGRKLASEALVMKARVSRKRQQDRNMSARAQGLLLLKTQVDEQP